LSNIYITIISRGDSLGDKNNKLKLARIEKDLTQEQLAEKIGVTRQTIGLIEAGKYNPTIKLCNAICKVLGKSLDSIFGEE
jgi:putative transcriptional regulator